MPFKNRRVSKKDTEVACGKTDSEIWKITKWKGSYLNYKVSKQSTDAMSIVTYEHCYYSIVKNGNASLTVEN